MKIVTGLTGLTFFNGKKLRIKKKKRINAFNAEIGTSFSIKGGEEGLFQVAHFVV